MHVATLEPGNRIQLPAEWVEEIGLADKAELERVEGGIFIHSPTRSPWDKLFATKLSIAPPTTASDELELSDDDCLY